MARVMLSVLALVGLVAGEVSHLGYKYSKPLVSAKVQLPIILPSLKPVISTEIKLSAAPSPVSLTTENIIPAEVEEKTSPISLPPLQSTEYIPPTDTKVIIPSPSPLAAIEALQEVKQKEGYKYPAPKPVQIVPEPVEKPVQIEVEPAHELASDGYRYKTVRRIKYRHRV